MTYLAIWIALGLASALIAHLLEGFGIDWPELRWQLVAGAVVAPVMVLIALGMAWLRWNDRPRIR
jgi:hypothetical protein